MANEITTLVQFQASKGGAQIEDQATTCQLDMSGAQTFDGTQDITTASWQAVTFGNLAGAPGMWKVKNTNTTAGQYVRFALDNAGANIFGRLQPGQQNLISVEPGATIYARATGATVKLRSKATDA